MGLTSEFVWCRRVKDNLKRKNVRLKDLSVDKVYTGYGKNSSKDTIEKRQKQAKSHKSLFESLSKNT